MRGWWGQGGKGKARDEVVMRGRGHHPVMEIVPNKALSLSLSLMLGQVCAHNLLNTPASLAGCWSLRAQWH